MQAKNKVMTLTATFCLLVLACSSGCDPSVRERPEPTHIKEIEKGRDVWNKWRKKYPNIKPHLNHANLEDKNLEGYDFSYTELSHANLRGSNLKNTDFRSAGLQFAALNAANLSSANLNGVNLNNAQLNYVNLSKANLSGAKLGSADLSDPDLREANLSYAYLSGADLNGAKYSEKTQLPEDFDPKQRGMILVRQMRTLQSKEKPPRSTIPWWLTDDY